MRRCGANILIFKCRKLWVEYNPWTRAQWDAAGLPMVLRPSQSLELILTEIWLRDMPDIVDGKTGFDFRRLADLPGHVPGTQTSNIKQTKSNRLKEKIETLKQQMRCLLRPDVPIITITAYGDAETKRQALEHGAEALLTKPIDFATLRSEIDMRVGRAA